jgi:hypothetical protein
MVSVEQDVPRWVLDGDIQTFFSLHDPSARVRQRLQEADDDDRVRLLARAWFSRYHGSRHEAKKMFVMLMKERDIPFNAEDVQAIVDRPPVETQT